MVKPALKIFSFFLLISLVSCRAGRVSSKSGVINGSASFYIENYKDLAISEMRRTGVPASITLAQGMLESDYGRSTLARVANNHFGIKCHNGWNGQTVRQHDDRRNECFRKYQRPEDSFYDHSDFLRSGSRYSSLFRLDPEDYKAWAHGLRRAGYATNPDYANMIIRKIEENNLQLIDRNYITASEQFEKQREYPTVKQAPPVKSAPESVNPPPAKVETITFGEVMARAPRILENNRVQYIIVKDGETKQKLDNEFQLLKRDLANYNDLNETFAPVAGQVLYLGPKREKAEAGKEFHIAAAGETMHLISQKYAIKLKSLLELNRMTDSVALVPGQKIWLQDIKPVN
ncbi:MAG: glucosaminidase domain-containing protein [Bacteroidales bacterium]